MLAPAVTRAAGSIPSVSQSSSAAWVRSATLASAAAAFCSIASIVSVTDASSGLVLASPTPRTVTVAIT
jgi:hypothetical protein